MPRRNVDAGDFFVELGARMREVRRARKVTQTKLAERLEVHRNTLMRCEHGEVRVDAWILSRFAKELNVSMRWLVGG